jgi:nucleoside-triphosphatase THEP1
MISRAVIIIIGFASISIELKNPLIKSVLYNKGFANLYQSLSLSFSALPFILESLPESKDLLKKSQRKNLKIFSQAELLLKAFENDYLKKPKIIIVTGEIQQGKTTFVRNVVENLQKRNIPIAGFLSIGINDKKERKGFDLLDIQTYRQIELCTKEVNEGWLNYGPYYFNPEGIKTGNEILNITNLTGKHLVITDEIGPVELDNQGWSNAIEKIIGTSMITHLWVVRRSLVKKVIRKWNTGDVYLFDIKESSPEEVGNKIMEIIYSEPQYDLKEDRLRSQI